MKTKTLKIQKAKDKLTEHWADLKSAVNHAKNIHARFWEDDHLEEMVNPKLRIAGH